MNRNAIWFRLNYGLKRIHVRVYLIIFNDARRSKYTKHIMLFTKFGYLLVDANFIRLTLQTVTTEGKKI